MHELEPVPSIISSEGSITNQYDGYFTENLGQFGRGAGLYYSNSETFSIALGIGWVAYDVPENGDDTSGTLVRITFNGSNEVVPKGQRSLVQRSNFFLGSDETSWIKGARSFREVVYENLWDGIDLRYRLSENGVKYEFIVQPSVDPSIIDMKVEGHDRLLLGSDGELLISTATGQINDGVPEVFYLDEPRSKVISRTIVRGVDSYGFEIGEYDTARTLVIDPLIYSTRLGMGNETGQVIAVDKNGSAYVAGITRSRMYPTTPGSYRSISDSSYIDNIFITKLSPDGVSIEYTALIGGDDSSYIKGIEIGEDGIVHLVGNTGANDFPTTVNLVPDYYYDQNVFVIRLSSDGSSIVSSTLFGGTNNDYVTAMALDDRGCVYVTGWTHSPDYPITPGALMAIGEYEDPYDMPWLVFVTKINPDGTSIVSSTILGSAWSGEPTGIVVDGEYHVYLCGFTSASDFPTTSGTYKPNFTDGLSNLFAAKLRPDFKSLTWSTFLHSTWEPINCQIAVDDDGSVYLAGTTRDDDFPTTDGAFQEDKTAPRGFDGFVCKLLKDASSLIFSTYIGGEFSDAITDMMVDKDGNTYIIGITHSENYPVTAGRIKGKANITNGDTFVTVLNSDGSDLIFSTLFGGNGVDYGSGLDQSEDGSLYITGKTNSTDLPVTHGGLKSQQYGGTFVIALDPDPDYSPVKVEDGPVLFAGYKYYRFSIIGNPSQRPFLPSNVSLHIDPSGANVTVLRTFPDYPQTPELIEVDPNDLLTAKTSLSIGDSQNHTVHYELYIEFNWTWPHENLCDMDLITEWSDGEKEIYTIEDLFSVENDLEIAGAIDVTGEWQGPVSEGDWVRSGEKVHLTGVKAVYQGTQDKFPPDGSCTLRIFDDDGDTETSDISSGVETEISINADNTTDPDETITLTLDDLLGHASCEKNWTMNLKVDGAMPEFNNPIPEGDDWHSELGMRVAISSMDLNGSGIDASTLEYSYSTNGTGGFGDWNRIDLDTEPDDETVDAMVFITLEEGDDNYLRWRVKDLVGNGYTISDDYLIRIDTNHIAFSSPTPRPGRWYTSITFESGCTISDRMGSGVDVRSIQFRVSLSYPSRYGDWIDWNEGSSLDGQEVVTLTEVEFSESSYNFIQWRAKDVAGNGFSTSPHYRYRIDIRPPEFTEISPNPDEKHESGEITILVVTTDDLSGVHWYFQYRFGTSGEESMGEWEEIDGHDSVPVFTFTVQFARGISNVLQLKIMDNAGNNATSEILSIWVNRRPVAVIAAPADRAVFQADETIELDGTGSYDEDGDTIIYGWWVDQNETPVLVDIGGTITLPPGTHNISLTIWDGSIGGFGNAEVQITVLEIPTEPEIHVEEDDWMLVVVIIIIIIIVVILGIVLRRTQMTPL